MCNKWATSPIRQPGRGARRPGKYVKGITFYRNTGEVLTGSRVRPQIDRKAIDAAARLNGPYLIVTSETGWEGSRILDAYRGLWRIEELFKVTKTGGLRSRPVWAWRRHKGGCARAT